MIENMRLGLHCCGLCQGDFYLMHRLTYGFVAKFVIFCLACVTFFAIGIIFIEKSLTQKLEPDPSDPPSAKKRLPSSAVALGTDVDDPSLHYGIVIDCGSSGSRVFVYFWPPHDGSPNELLHIEQMRDREGQLVMKKIEPGISSFANSPSEASKYLEPLLKLAADHVPAEKHKETPLYIMATAGMRMLPEKEQEAILDDLEVDIPMMVDFLFTKTHMEVISGKQEGIYAWIGLNYVLGRFDHYQRKGDPVVEVEVPGPEHQRHIRKRTAGIIDMGGASLQVAFEVPKSESISQNLLAEFNLGCSTSDLDHSYRVYVTTFLGYGANVARNRYEEQLVEGIMMNKANSSTLQSQRVSSQSQAPVNKDSIDDPCLPVDIQRQMTYRGHTYSLKGTGKFGECRDSLKPLLNQTNPCAKEPCTINGVFQPSVDHDNSEFYGFSEFYYSTEDLLRIGGKYNHHEFEREASDYCATRWATLQKWYEKKLFARADEFRFKMQCFKSAWISAVFHQGLHFPDTYKHFTTAQLIDGKEVQWTLGALLYKTRYYPLREIEKHSSFHAYKPSWVKEVSNSYHLLILCFLIVVAAILIYLRRLRLVRRPDLRRVPTMSYFMTEADQMEEGVLLDTKTMPVALS